MAQSNRDVIIGHIARMDDEQLGRFLSEFNIEYFIDPISCADCQARNGGSCPGGDNDCIDIDHVQWLSWPCHDPARLRAALDPTRHERS